MEAHLSLLAWKVRVGLAAHAANIQPNAFELVFASGEEFGAHRAVHCHSGGVVISLHLMLAKQTKYHTRWQASLDCLHLTSMRRRRQLVCLVERQRLEWRLVDMWYAGLKPPCSPSLETVLQSRTPSLRTVF